jgi:hypothetical protein
MPILRGAGPAVSMHKLHSEAHRHGGQEDCSAQTQRQNPLQDPWTSPDRLNSPGGLIPAFRPFSTEEFARQAPHLTTPCSQPMVDYAAQYRAILQAHRLAEQPGSLLAGSVTDTSTYDYPSTPRNCHLHPSVPHLSASTEASLSTPGSQLWRSSDLDAISGLMSQKGPLRTSGKRWQVSHHQLQTQGVLAPAACPLKPLPVDSQCGH